MVLGQFLEVATLQLKKAGIGTARLDCLILLSDALGKDKAWILAHPESPLQGRALQRLEKQLKRREKHEPMAYIRGFTEFYGRNFLINKDVLEPRPESETIIELLKQLVGSRQLTVDSPLKTEQLTVSRDGSWKNEIPTIADVGTGSGAIAITVKLELPEAKVIGTDIDENCLIVARKNAKNLNADVEFLQGNLLEPLFPILHSSFFILICNLPYVPDHWAINEAAAMEPKIAIFGGSDGLDLYRKLFQQLNDSKGRTLNRGGFVLTESLPPQHKELANIAKKSGYKLLKAQDFIQLFNRI